MYSTSSAIYNLHKYDQFNETSREILVLILIHLSKRVNKEEKKGTSWTDKLPVKRLKKHYKHNTDLKINVFTALSLNKRLPTPCASSFSTKISFNHPNISNQIYMKKFKTFEFYWNKINQENLLNANKRVFIEPKK